MIAALMGLMLSMAQDPTIVWSAEEPAPTPTPVSQPIAAPIVDIPEWGRNDPYAWERAQCSPLLRGDEDLASCQSRLRIELDAAPRQVLALAQAGERRRVNFVTGAAQRRRNDLPAPAAVPCAVNENVGRHNGSRA